MEGRKDGRYLHSPFIPFGRRASIRHFLLRVPRATLAQPRAFCALEASFPKLSAIAERTPANHPAPRVINTDEHAAYPPAVAQLKAEGALAEDYRHRPVPYLNNHARAGPPRHQAAGQRQSAFPLLLGSLAHGRRLRGDSYDSQRPSVRKCGGAKVSLLHHFIVDMFGIEA